MSRVSGRGLFAIAICLAGCGAAKTKPTANTSTKPPVTIDTDVVSCTTKSHMCIEALASSSQIETMQRECPHMESMLGVVEGTFHRGPCPKEGVESACSVKTGESKFGESKIYSYRDTASSDEARRGAVMGAHDTCVHHGHTFRLEEPSTVVSCAEGPANQIMICSEETVFPMSNKVIDLIMAKCKERGGTPRTESCPRQNTIGECALYPDHTPTIFTSVVVYKGKSDKETKDLVRELTAECQKHEGNLSLQEGAPR